MIKEAGAAQKDAIYELLQSAYPTRSRAYLGFYFKYIYDQGKTICLEQDERIIAAMSMHEHVMNFNGRKLLVSFLSGVATLPDYRRRGHMRYLMQSMLDEAEHNHLITLIEAFNPKLYETFGFETIYQTKTYTINSRYFEKVKKRGVSHNVSAVELFELYQKYAKHFDGCYVRDTQYFETFMRKALLDHGNICVYRNKDHEVCGYAVYEENSVEVRVHEIVYVDSIALMKMLRFISEGYPDVTVTVSPSEKLEKLFPLTIPKKSGYTMARINNYELFNKLYNSKVKSVKEAFAITKKPLFLHEEY